MQGGGDVAALTSTPWGLDLPLFAGAYALGSALSPLAAEAGGFVWFVRGWGMPLFYARAAARLGKVVAGLATPTCELLTSTLLETQCAKLNLENRNR